MSKKDRSGFTLPELLIATVIGISVFFAMGTLLSRSFSIWYNGMAQWKLAQHARVTRIRLLDGGFGKGSGLLSSKDIEIASSDDWIYLKYFPVYSGKEHRTYGWSTDSDLKDLRLETTDMSFPVQNAYAQSVKFYGDEAPDVKVNEFDVTQVSSQTLQLTYTLRFSAAGRNFEHPQTVRAVLLNSD